VCGFKPYFGVGGVLLVAANDECIAVDAIGVGLSHVHAGVHEGVSLNCQYGCSDETITSVARSDVGLGSESCGALRPKLWMLLAVSC